jgi:hypothetical protein
MKTIRVNIPVAPRVKDITDEAEGSQYKMPLSEQVKLACPGGSEISAYVLDLSAS